MTTFLLASHRRLAADIRRGRLRALSDELAADAARLGVRGGIQEAFGEVFAEAVDRQEERAA